MKWSILGLSLLGTLAAACAVVLVLSLQTSGSPPAPQAASPAKVQVIVAARDLEPRQVIGADDVTTQEVDAEDVPAGALGDPVRTIGRVLISPMKTGQPFLDGSFAGEGSGLHLASTLPAGQRAMSVSLSDDLGMEEGKKPGAVRKTLGLVLNLGLASVLLVALVSLETIYLNGGKLDASALSLEPIKALF